VGHAYRSPFHERLNVVRNSSSIAPPAGNMRIHDSRMSWRAVESFSRKTTKLYDSSPASSDPALRRAKSRDPSPHFADDTGTVMHAPLDPRRTNAIHLRKEQLTPDHGTEHSRTLLTASILAPAEARWQHRKHPERDLNGVGSPPPSSLPAAATDPTGAAAYYHGAKVCVKRIADGNASANAARTPGPHRQQGKLA